MKAVKKSATRTAMRTLDGTENTERREEGDGGRGEERKRVRLDERASTLRGRERERGKTRAAMGHRGRRWGGEVDRVTYRCC